MIVIQMQHSTWTHKTGNRGESQRVAQRGCEKTGLGEHQMGQGTRDVPTDETPDTEKKKRPGAEEGC